MPVDPYEGRFMPQRMLILAGPGFGATSVVWQQAFSLCFNQHVLTDTSQAWGTGGGTSRVEILPAGPPARR